MTSDEHPVERAINLYSSTITAARRVGRAMTRLEDLHRAKKLPKELKNMR